MCDGGKKSVGALLPLVSGVWKVQKVLGKILDGIIPLISSG